MVSIRERIEHLLGLMEAEIDLFQVEKKIRGRVKQQMEKSQREYYLNEQMKAIQKELGDMGEEGNETEELEKKIAEAGMPAEAEEKARAELRSEERRVGKESREEVWTATHETTGEK